MTQSWTAGWHVQSTRSGNHSAAAAGRRQLHFLRCGLGLTAVALGLAADPAAAQLRLSEASTFTAAVPSAGGDFGNTLLDVSRTNGQTRSVLVGTRLTNADNLAFLDPEDGTVSMQDAADRVTATALCETNNNSPLVIAGVPGFDAALRGGPPNTDTGVVRLLNSFNLGLIAEWDQENWPGETLESGDQFGTSLATGDFDGDGFCDVAIGAPAEDVGTIVDAGAVYLVYGPLSSPSFEGPITQSTSGIATGNEESDGFGEILARGPRQGGRDSLLVGAPREDFFDIVDTGAVWWIPGSATGLDPDASSFLLLGQAQVPVDGDELFGSAFAVGDFNGDGDDDVAIGAPENGINSGAVAVYPGPLTSPVGTDQIYLISAFDFPSSTGSGEVIGRSFGRSLAAGEWTGDYPDDLLIGAPDSQVGTDLGAGAIYWSRGTVGGPAQPQAVLVQGDLPGHASESNERFGDQLLVTRPYSTDAAALVIGVPQEVLDAGSGARGFDLNQGVVHVIPTIGRLREVSSRAVESYGCGPLAPCDFISGLGDPTVDQNGDIAFPGQQFDSEGFVVEWPLQQTYGGASYQFGNDLALSPEGDLLARELSGAERLAAFDTVQGERTLLQVGTIDGPFEWTSLGPFQLDASGSAFVLANVDLQPGGQYARGIYRSTTLQPGSFSKVIAVGDAIGGVATDTVQDVLYSLDIAHDGTWAAMVELNATRGIPVGWAFAVDDTIVWRQGQTVDGFVVDAVPNLFAINSESWAIGLPFVDHPIKVFDDQGAVFSSSDTIEGRSLAPMDPYAMALNNAGDLVVVWTSSQSGIENFATLSCADGSPTRILLAEGDRATLNFGDATFAQLGSRFDTRPERTPQGTVVLHAEAWFDDGGPPFDAVVEVEAPCPLFYDGFESGDVLVWSATTP